jgi:hypothetical protein
MLGTGRGVKTFQIIITTITFLVLAATPSTFAETENYCNDKAAALAWDQLVKVSPNDLELQRLHALRLGICEKIEKGSLSLDQGMTIFEAERERAVQKRDREERAEKKRI